MSKLEKFYFKFNGQHYFFNRPVFCFNKKYRYKKYETRVLYLIFHFFFVLIFMASIAIKNLRKFKKTRYCFLNMA
jgi:hypothetical protein